jgi:response regulator RpfG family c-di-GMP phosphodiesterase
VEVSESTAADHAIPVEVEGSAPATAPTAPPIIVVDPELSTLEWMKQGLRSHFPRVHIFQRSELATARVRQYLGRAEVPLVLLSAEASDDRVTGAKGVAEIVARLRAHSPRLRILLLTGDGSPTTLPSELKGVVWGCVKRPSAKEVRKKTGAGRFGDSVRDAMQGGASEPSG